MRLNLLLLLIIITTTLFSQTEPTKKEYRMTTSNQKVLIAYASEAGSTAEVASFINDIITEAEIKSECINVKNINSVEDYDIIFIGSPIYMGKWKKEATKFIEINQEQFKDKKIFYFLTCMSLSSNEEDKLAQVPKFLEYERSLITPLSEGRFAGVINPKKLSFMQRMMIKMVRAPEGDFRDWEKIANWTKECIAFF